MATIRAHLVHQLGILRKRQRGVSARRLAQIFLRREAQDNEIVPGALLREPIVVPFAGGLGAQILSLSIVLDFRRRGIPVGVNLDYFSREPRIARPGEGISIWGWALGMFGWSREEVLALDTLGSRNGVPHLKGPIVDLALAIEALLHPEIKSFFPGVSRATNFRALGLGIENPEAPYVAFHLRRGDYLNVAAHVVPDSVYVEATIPLSKAFELAVVATDSPLERKVRERFSRAFDRVIILEGHEHDAGQVHHVLRNSAAHVGSNGQFSLTAGLLGDGAYFRPTPWFESGAAANSVFESFMPNSMQLFFPARQ